MKIIILIILSPFLVVAQDIRQLIRKADQKYENGEYILATELYSSVKQYYSSAKQYENYLHYSWKKAWAYTEIQERTKAIEELKHSMAFAIGKKTKIQDTTIFKHYSLLYHNYVLLSRADSAKYYAELNDKLLLKNPQIEKIANAYYYFRMRGYIEDIKGNVALSEPYFKKASKVIEKLQVSEKCQAYNGLGIHYQIQNNLETAKKYFLLAYNQAFSDIDKAYFILNAAATTSEDKVFEMREYLQKAKLHYKKHNIKDNKLEYDLALREGLIWSLEEKYNYAEKKYKHCIEICEKAYLGRTPWMQNTAFIKLSQNAVLQNELKKAIDYAQKAIQVIHFDFQEDNIFKNPPINRGIFDRFLYDALTQKAKVTVLIYQKTKDKRYLTLASEIFGLQAALATKIRIGYEGESSKLFLLSQVKPAFDLGIETLYDTDNQKCFEFQERTKSSILLDALLNAEKRVKFLPDSILTKEDNLDKERTTLIRSIIDATTARQKDSIESLIVDKDIAIETFKKKLNIDYPLYAKEKYSRHIPTIKQIQNSIDNTTSVISYYLTTQKLYVFVIDKSAYRLKKVVINSDFLNNLKDFRNLLANSPQGKKYNGQALSAELYDVLIKPIEKEIEGKKRLIIIRDAELNYLPFEVLAKKKDDYLLKKYTISYAYSTSLLLPTKKPRKQGSGLLGFAPFSNNSFQQSLFRDKNLGQLPKSGNEVEKIGGDIYLEDEATKKRFYETYRNKNVIHFATHAITDDSDPLKSFIAFYPDNTDYKLFTNELYDLDLRNTSLVMLSACETGAGKLQKGEGVMSLARAFSYAGTKAVITTLWNAHDEASAYISERFYKHLKGGLKTDEALQKAKLDFLKSDLALRYEHPYYWANFVLIGPAESIKFGNNGWIWVIPILLLVFSIYFFRRKVTKK